MHTPNWTVGSGRPEALVVLLHGLDHCGASLAPIARALLGLFEWRGGRRVGWPRSVAVWSPYRGGRVGVGGAPTTLAGVVAEHYAPLAARHPDVPIVTIGESLGAAIAHEWALSEPRVAHQIQLDPFPRNLPLGALDRWLVRAAMAAQRTAFRLRHLGINVTGGLDAGLIAQALDSLAANDRRSQLRTKRSRAHIAVSLQEAALIARIARLRGPAAPAPACATTVFLPPADRSTLVTRLMARIVQAAIDPCRPVRAYRADVGNHFNLSEMAAPHIASEVIRALAPREEPDGDAFARWYWSGLSPATVPRLRRLSIPLLDAGATEELTPPLAAPFDEGR